MEATAHKNFMALLICKNEGESARIVPLGNAILFIGRDPNSGIYIDTSEISRNHASISFVDGRYILRDNGSTNGSFLNGERVAEGVLAHGDEIRFGPYVFSVDLLATPASTPQEPEEPANLERRGHAYRSSITFKELKGHEDEGMMKIMVSAFRPPSEEPPLETTTKVAKQCLPAVGPIQHLSLEARGLLSLMGSFQQALPGERLLVQGTSNGGLIFILSGSLETRRKEDGKEKVLGTIEAGEWIGEGEIFEPQTAAFSIEAMSPVSYWIISLDRLETFLNDHPDSGAILLIGLGATLGRRLRHTTAIHTSSNRPLPAWRRHFWIYAVLLLGITALCVTPWVSWRKLVLSHDSAEFARLTDQKDISDRNEASLQSKLEENKRALEIKTLEADTYANEVEATKLNIEKLNAQIKAAAAKPIEPVTPAPQPAKPEPTAKPTETATPQKTPTITLPPEITLTKATVVTLTSGGKKIGNAKFVPGKKFAPVGVEGDRVLIVLGSSKTSIPIGNTNFAEALAKFKSEASKTRQP